MSPFSASRRRVAVSAAICLTITLVSARQPASADDFWVGLFTKTDGANAYYQGSLDFVTGKIKSAWKKGWQISDVSHADGRWFVTLNKRQSQNAYFVGCLDCTIKEIRKRDSEGMRPVAVASGDDLWFTVFSKSDGRWAYSHGGLDYVKRAIRSQWKKDMDLVDICCNSDGTWLAIFHDEEDGIQNAFATASSMSRVEQYLKEYWAKGIPVADIGYGDGIWFLVFRGRKGETQQAAWGHLSYMAQSIEGKWDDGYELVATAGIPRRRVQYKNDDWTEDAHEYVEADYDDQFIDDIVNDARIYAERLKINQRYLP